jgi:beta-galactosidase
MNKMTVRFRKRIGALLLCALVFTCLPAAAEGAAHTFAIGDEAFLLDGKPFQIRCGELHFARIPQPYWRQRLQMCKAMGLNTVCAYLFWNYHATAPGVFTWTGNADAAEFCRIAQEEGLWVILRPGPYSCAEWEGGGVPWWLLKEDGIVLRSRDPRFLNPAKAWLREVGRVLAPLQITRGGPILMTQVENEYGFYGSDKEYIRELRQAELDAGFDVPLFACNPPRVTQNGLIPELFQSANFGGDPAGQFAALRKLQPKGPLFCSEYYPAWFDNWGLKHHGAKSDKDFFGPIEWMLQKGASFSIYMVHGGTTFGFWSGCSSPFSPNITSYDYEAPVNENGRPNPSFLKARELFSKFDPAIASVKLPPEIPVARYPDVALDKSPIASMAVPSTGIASPVPMEKLGQGFGLVEYSAAIPAGAGGVLKAKACNDFGYVSLDNKRAGILDRRHRGIRINIPKSAKPQTLSILVEAMGRINFGHSMDDRKGLQGPVSIGGTELTGWHAALFPLGEGGAGSLGGRMTWLGTLTVPATQGTPADTFLDMRGWTKGIVWVNGHCLGRYWDIGPQQTLYLPGCWLKPGANKVELIDFFGPRGKAVLPTLDKAILDELKAELDFHNAKRPGSKLERDGLAAEGEFPAGNAPQEVRFKQTAKGRRFAIEALSSHGGKNLASIAELEFTDAQGKPISSDGWSIYAVDSEDEAAAEGTAENAIDGQTAAFWQSARLADGKPFSHWLVVDFGGTKELSGFRYTPRQDKDIGRIKSYRAFVQR